MKVFVVASVKESERHDDRLDSRLTIRLFPYSNSGLRSAQSFAEEERRRGAKAGIWEDVVPE